MSRLAIGLALWFGLTGVFGFAVYVQEVTISSYDKSGDCHTSYFRGVYGCSKEVEKQGMIYLTLNDTRLIEIGFVVAMTLTQIICATKYMNYKQRNTEQVK